MSDYLEAAQVQGFTWGQPEYEFKTESGKHSVKMHFDETAYLVLAMRYKELFRDGGSGGMEDVPYEIDP